MSSKKPAFIVGFEKEAFIGPMVRAGLGAVGQGAKWLGGKLIQGMGGKLNAAATAVGVASDAQGYSSKLKAAREGLM